MPKSIKPKTMKDTGNRVHTEFKPGAQKVSEEEYNRVKMEKESEKVRALWKYFQWLKTCEVMKHELDDIKATVDSGKGTTNQDGILISPATLQAKLEQNFVAWRQSQYGCEYQRKELLEVYKLTEEQIHAKFEEMVMGKKTID